MIYLFGKRKVTPRMTTEQLINVERMEQAVSLFGQL